MSINAHILSKYVNDVFIETGTEIGEGVDLAESVGFKQLHTIDIEQSIFLNVNSKWLFSSNRHAYLGSSDLILPKILNNIVGRITFWLDAHPPWNSLNLENTPLVGELRVIKEYCGGLSSEMYPTVLIDDMRLFSQECVDRLIDLCGDLYPNCNVYRIDGVNGKRDILCVQPNFSIVGWIKQLQNMGRKVYSQGNQDGFIEYVFKKIGTTNKFCVEFGFNAFNLIGGSGSNVARLVLEDGWNQLLLDSCFDNPFINLHKQLLTPENIVSVFKKYKVPNEPDYISIDVDGIDLWLFRAILVGGYRPRLVSVEYNSNFPINFNYTVKKDFLGWNGDANYGASFLALIMMAKEFGYYPVCVESTLDVFFLREDLFNNEDIPQWDSFSEFTNISLHNSSTLQRSLFVEYSSLDIVDNNSKNGIIYLINTDRKYVDDFINSLILLKKNYLQDYPCPVVGFYESSLPLEIRKTINDRSGVPVQYIEVDFSVVPDIYDKNRLLDVRLGYHHMCHFFANDVFHQPVVKDWEYYLRLDTDSFILSQVGYDIFEEARKKNVFYGFVGISDDSPRFQKGLRDVVKKYVENHSSCEYYKSLDKIPECEVYYNNFEVCFIPWFQQEPWISFFKTIDKSGGIWTTRWGDHAIRTYGVNLLMSSDHIYQYKDIHYKHAEFENNPQVDSRIKKFSGISCCFEGGLGNQMFQAAHALAQSWRYNREAVFIPRWRFVTEYEPGHAGNSPSSYQNNVFRNLKFVESIDDFSIIESPNWYFTKMIPQDKNTSFRGYFQSSKNFYGFDKKIRDIFSPPESWINEILQRYPQLKQDNTVSVNVRRGDYLFNPDIHPVVSLNYINNALDEIGSYSTMFVLSDDVKWVRENMHYENMVIVEIQDYEGMWLMSLCKNNIISNSTYSWWSAFLNRNPNKIVCCPEKWFGLKGPLDWSDIYCDGWSIIPEEPVKQQIVVNLFDSNFAHSIGENRFDSSCLIKPTKIKYTRNQMIFDGVTVFTDEFMFSSEVDLVKTKTKIGWIIEPPSIKPLIYQNINSVEDSFDYIFTYSFDLVEKNPVRYKYLPFGGSRLNMEDRCLWPKTKRMSHWVSNKNWTEGHILRHRIASEISNVDVYKTPFDKMDIHRDYEFSIVVENIRMRGYFTEKLIDCMAQGTIPIYWGDPEIGRHFNLDGIIQVSSLEEILSLKLEEGEYQKRIEAVRDNFERCKRFMSTDDNLADLIVGVQNTKLSNSAVVVVCARNCESWIAKCLQSVVDQTYSDIGIVFVDDSSDDKTLEIARSILGDRKHAIIVNNQHRNFVLKNTSVAVGEYCDNPESVVFTVDGDDWLACSTAIEEMMEKHKQYDVVWSRYKPTDNSYVNSNLLSSNDIRKHPWVTSHLRSFKKFLFDAIQDKDFRDEDGDYYKMAGDLAVMFPILEMTPHDRRYFYDKELYVYNHDNPNNDDKISLVNQMRSEHRIRFSPVYQIHPRYLQYQMKPKISVVIPSFNYGKYLDGAIQSVLNQTYRNFELILVNYGSTDDTALVMERYRDRATILNIPNKDVGNARNSGIDVASGKYILCLDADDILNPTFLEETVLLANDDLIVATECQYFGDRNGYGMPVVANLDTFKDMNCVLCCSLFPKTMWTKIGGFDETMDKLEDWDFWLRGVGVGYKVEIIHKKLVNVRTHSKSRNTNSKKSYAETKQYILEKFNNLALGHP